MPEEEVIAKSEFSEVIADIVLLLEKQVKDFSRTEITDFLEVLNSGDDENLPVIVFGKNGQLLFKNLATNKTTLITKESIQEILDYDEFQKSGIITLRKVS